MRNARRLALTITLLAALPTFAFNDPASRFRRVNFADLGAPLAGSVYYCLDCTAAAPCGSGGTGAFAYRVGTAWNCTVGSGGLTSPVGVADGGTGLTTLTANNVILGNGTSTPSFVAPSTSGNVLTSNGTTWTSAAAAASGANTALSNLASVAINTALVTGAGVTAALTATAPAQTASAQAGTPVTITASDAIAGSSNAGAAAGGDITITAKDAKRLTSGDGRGGQLTLGGGAGIGAGRRGSLKITDKTVLRFDGNSDTSGQWIGFLMDSSIDTASMRYRNDIDVASFNARGINLLRSALMQWSLLDPAVCASANTCLGINDVGTSIGAIADGTGGVNVFGGAGSSATTNPGGIQITSDTTGSYVRQKSNTELLTLSTGGTTTATSANLVPANSDLNAVMLRVTTTITTATSFSVAVTGGNALCPKGSATSTLSTLTAGTTYVLGPCPATFGVDSQIGTASTITVTTNLTPGAGAVRITTAWTLYSPPSS